MPVTIEKLHECLTQTLQPSSFRDYAPNGLQVSGKKNINKIITGVTASLDFIKAAIESKADSILVHHGYFWKGEDPCLTHTKYNRIKLLIENNISLFAYHLPLDAHPELGNNAQLAKILNFSIINRIDVSSNCPILFYGELANPIEPNKLSEFLNKKLNHKPLHISPNQHKIKKIAWCTGAAQDYIFQASQLGVDAYISGEISERTFHDANELNIHYYSAGHHATERYGIKALGEYLENKLGIEHEFIDIPNPV